MIRVSFIDNIKIDGRRVYISVDVHYGLIIAFVCQSPEWSRDIRNYMLILWLDTLNLFAGFQQ